MRRKAVVLHGDDNVASALADLEAGEEVSAEIPGGAQVVVSLVGGIPLGHKFALRDIPYGAEVIKYGVPIGRATQDVRRGEHVHTQNLA